MKYLDNMGEDEILELNIPTGVPLVYEFDENFKPIKHYYLGNAEEIAAKAVAVANQVKRSNFSGENKKAWKSPRFFMTCASAE